MRMFVFALFVSIAVCSTEGAAGQDDTHELLAREFTQLGLETVTTRFLWVFRSLMNVKFFDCRLPSL